MTDFGSASVTIKLDSREAEAQLRRFIQETARVVAQIRVEAETRHLGPQVQAAIDAADTGIEVTAEAKDVTGSIDSAVEDADSNVVVTGDARELTGEVEGSIDAADSSVTVTGDARELTAEVTGAVDAGDSHVVVTGDATELTGDVTAAVDAGDSHVVLTADAGSLRDATNASDELGLSLGTARLNATNLGTVIRGGLFIGLAKQLYDATTAASALSESQNKANEVFGDSTDIVTDFGTTSAQAIGLSTRAATESAGTFGNLFTAMGLGREAAAGMSTDVLTLGADLASFNNLGVDETLEKIRSGLVGEIEPLRSLGVSFNAANVEAKAMELGLADANGEISEGAKVQARYALISEQSKNAQGDFARTSEGLANQQRILRAEFDNAVVSIGQGMLPVLLDLVSVAREEGIPAFQNLAVAGGRVFAESLAAVIPLLGTTTSILLALEPVLSTVADTINAIPDPVLRVAAAFFALNRIIGLARGAAGIAGVSGLLGGLATNARTAATQVGTGGLAGGFSIARGAGGGLLGVLKSINPLTAVAAGGLVALGISQDRAAERAAKVADQFRRVEEALSSTEDPVLALTGLFNNLAREAEAFQINARDFAEVDLKQLFDETGVSARELSRAVEGGLTGINRLAEAVDDGTDQGREYSDQVRDVGAQLLAAADKTINLGVETGRWTEKEAAAAREVARLETNSTNSVGALERLEQAEGEAGTAAEAHAEALELTNEALGSIQQTAPAVTQALSDMIAPGGDAGREFAALALSADAANLSQEQMQAIADRLGVDLEELAPAVGLAAGALDGLKSSAGGAVPGLDDLSGQVDDLKNLTAPKLTETLSGVLLNLTEFNNNLALVISQAPSLATIAADAPEVAAVIAEALRNGDLETVKGWENIVRNTRLQMDRQGRIIDENGVVIIDAMGNIGEGSADEFGKEFTPDRPTRTAMQRAQTRIQEAKDGIRREGAGAGRGGRQGFEGEFTPDRPARTRIEAARLNIRSAKDGVLVAGGFVGTGGRSGFDTSFTPSGPARDRMEAARLRIRLAREGMRVAGDYAGAGARAGLLAGMDTSRRTIDPVVRKVRNRVMDSIRAIFDIRSPSRVMIPLGAQISAGLVEGITSNEAQLRNIIRSIGGKLSDWIHLFIGPGGGVGGLREPLASKIAALLSLARGQVSLISGFRSRAQQEVLYAQYRARGFAPPQVARPGTSMHERGLAADLGGNRALYTRLARSLGLWAPVPGEPWHWEVPGSRALRGAREGIWRTRDEVRQLHPDEMVLTRQIATAVRASVATGRGAQEDRDAMGTSVVIQNLIIQVPGAPTPDQARAIGRNVEAAFSGALESRRLTALARMH